MKKIKKLSALILGGLLALGVGAGLGASDFQRAEAATASFTINARNKSLGSSGSYQTSELTTSYNGGPTTVDIKWNNVNPSNGQLRGNQTTKTNMQSGGNFYFRNSTALPGNIRSISIAYTSADSTFVAASIYAATGSAQITNQTTTDSTAGTSGSSIVTWSFTGTSGGYFAIGTIKGGTSGTALASNIVITYEEASSDVVTALSVNPTSKSLLTTNALVESDYTVSITKNRSAGSSADYTSQIGTGTGASFTGTDIVWGTTLPKATDTRIQFKAKYPNTAGGSTFLTAEVALTVNAPAATSVNVSAAGGATDVEVGATLQLSAAVLPTGANQSVTWSSSNGSFATVNSSGVVTGVAIGSVTIIATSTTPGITGTIALNVIPVPPGKKVIFPDNGSDSGTAFTTVTMSTATNGLKDAINGDFITSTVSTNNVYPGATGFKYGSSSTPGKWRFTTAETVTKVEAVFKQYSSDTAQGKITSHESPEKTITSGNLTSETTLVLSGTSSNEFSIDVTGKRGYLISIHFTYGVQAVMTETLSVTGTLTNGNQYSGSYLDVSGLTFTANYDDGGTQVLNVNQLNQPFPKLVYGTNSYQVSYTEAGITATGTVSLTVLQDTLNSLSWTGKKTTYNEGETLDQGTILAKYGSGNEVPLTLEDVAIYIYTGTWNPTTATIITALTILNNLDHDGVYVKLGYEGVYSIAASITVNFIPTTMYTEGGDGTCDTATLIKDIANLNVGDKVLIAASGTHNFVMSTTQNGNNRGSVAATKSGDKITDVDETTMQVVTIVAGTETDSFGFYVGDAGYLYAAGASSNNHLRTKTTLDANGSFIITIASDGVATATSQMTGTKNKLKFNSTNNPPIFSCYDSGQADIAFYSLDSAGSSGLNYEYLLDVLAGDWCDMDL